MPATCKERYIPADEFEEVAGELVSDALRNPVVLVAELDDHFKTGGGDSGRKMASLRREILDLKVQEDRLAEMRRRGSLSLDVLESQGAPLKALREEKERALRVLEDKQKFRDDAALNLSRIVELCRQLSDRLEEQDEEGKRTILASFNVRVDATREELSVTVTVDPNFTTTERTWASPRERSHRCRSA